jgi:hypothetical protein
VSIRVHWNELPPATRRRLIGLGLGRVLGTTIVLVTLWGPYVSPYSNPDARRAQRQSRDDRATTHSDYLSAPGCHGMILIERRVVHGRHDISCC